MTAWSIPLSGRPWMLALVCALAAVPAEGLADTPDQAGSEAAAAGQPGGAARLEVGWSDLVKLVDAHPRVAAGRYALAAARAGVDLAGAVPNPSLAAHAAYGRARDGSSAAFEWGLGLSVPLGWIGRRPAEVDAAGARAVLARAEIRSTRRDVLRALRSLFWNLVYEQERVAALVELGRQTDALAALVRRRVDKGESRPVEATRLEVEAQKIAGELAAASAILAARRSQLGAWLGVGAAERVVAVADLAELPEPPPEARIRAEALSAQPAVAAAAARVKALEAEVRVERGARVPSAALEAFADHELDRRAYGLGLAVDLPLWNWNSAGIERAEAELAASRARLDAELLEVESAAIEARSVCEAGVSLAARYRDEVLPRAASVARTIEKTYELGEATLLEVVDARRTLLDTRREYLSTLVRAHEDCSRLAALIGEEVP